MSVLIEFDIPADPLSMNDSDGAAAKRSKIARRELWKEAAHYAAVAAFPGVGPSGRRVQTPCRVLVSIPVAGVRRRDRSNWQPTVKVICDALVDAGLFPDDDDELVDQPNPTLRVVPPKELWKSKVYVRVVPRGEG